MAYHSYCFSDPDLTADVIKPDSSDVELFAKNGFNAWGQELSSKEFSACLQANELYFSWKTALTELEMRYDIVKVESSRLFKVTLPNFEYEHYRTELERLTKLGIFKTLLVVTLRPKRGNGVDEYVIVGCIDKRKLSKPQAPSHSLRRTRCREFYGQLEIAPEDEGAYRNKVTGELYKNSCDYTDAVEKYANDPVIADDLGKHPEYTFAICHFSTETLFAQDTNIASSAATVASLASKKSSRLSVSEAEVKRLPTSVPKALTYGLAIFFVTMLILMAVAGSWISFAIYLPIWCAIVAYNARGTEGPAQIAYLKAKHMVLPRKMWYIEE